MANELKYYEDRTYLLEYDLQNNDQFSMGILAGLAQPEELVLYDIIKLQEENQIEYYQESFNINIKLSTNDALINKGIDLCEDLKILQGQINQLQFKVELWDSVLTKRKQEVQDYDEDTDNDYDYYLTRRENTIRNEHRMNYWNTMSEYDKTMMLSLEMRKELLERKQNQILNEVKIAQGKYEKQMNELFDSYQWKMAMVTLHELGDAAIKAIGSLTMEHEKIATLLKQHVIYEIKQKAHIYQNLGSLIEKINEKIKFFDNEISVDFERVMEISSDIEYQYQHSDENSL